MLFCFLAAPRPPPANVSGYNTSSTSIFVQWDQAPAAHQSGAILYYTVTYRALPSGSLQTKNVTAPANQTSLTDLNEYTNYSISMFASTSRGAGNVSAPIFIFTDEDSKLQDLCLAKACAAIFSRETRSGEVTIATERNMQICH